MSNLKENVWNRNPLDLNGITDMHTHLGPWINFPISGYNPDSMITQMDRVGVSRIVSFPQPNFAEEVKMCNDWTLEAAKLYPERIIPFAVCYPINKELGIDEIKRCINSGMKGIKIHTSTGFAYAAYEYSPIWQYADSNGLPVILHTWGDADKLRPILEKFSNVKIILGHAGAVNPEQYVEYGNMYPNVYLELCNSGSKNGIVKFFVQNLPIEKIVYGSDCPWIPIGHQICRVVFADISLAQKKTILVDNPIRILGF